MWAVGVWVCSIEGPTKAIHVVHNVGKSRSVMSVAICGRVRREKSMNWLTGDASSSIVVDSHRQKMMRYVEKRA
jgi:hypothetical protein